MDVFVNNSKYIRNQRLKIDPLAVLDLLNMMDGQIVIVGPRRLGSKAKTITGILPPRSLFMHKLGTVFHYGCPTIFTHFATFPTIYDELNTKFNLIVIF